jgi:putative transposase
MQAVYEASERRALRVFRWPRSTHRQESVADPQTALRLRLRELAQVRVAYGYRRLTVLLKREGWPVNHKRVYRLYRQEGLVMRRKMPRRRVACVKREIRPAALMRNECWSMDFVSDQLFDTRRLRVLAVIENYTRECLALEASARIRGIDVVTSLECITRTQGYPKRIKVDNGPEFISKDLDRWAYWNKVELDFSRPGRPSDNALVESFNSRLRQECLNLHWFLSLEDARAKLAAWQLEYNTERPHSSLGHRSPIQGEPKPINDEATAA